VTGTVRIGIGTALAVGTMLLAGCGSDLPAQTARMVSAVPGGSATVTVPGPAGGTVAVRNAVVVYPPSPVGYAAGGTARLALFISNVTGTDIALVAVTATVGGASAGTVVLTTSASPSPSAAASSPPPATPSATASAGRPTGRPSATPSATAASPSPSATPSTPALAGDARINLSVPAGGYLDLGPGSPVYLQLDQLATKLAVGDTVQLVLTFQPAGGARVRTDGLAAPVAPPAVPAPRTSVSFGTGGQ